LPTDTDIASVQCHDNEIVQWDKKQFGDSIMPPEFDSINDLIAWFKEHAKEENGKFFIAEIKDIQTEMVKVREGKDKLVEDRKKVTAKKNELEKKLAELEPQIEEYKSQIEALKKEGNADEKMQALITEKSAIEKEYRKSKEVISSFAEKEKQLVEFQHIIEDYKNKEKTARIWEELSKEAKAIDIPEDIVNFELKRYSADFDINEDDEIIQKADPQKTIKTSLLEWQKERKHWQPVSSGGGANPGNKTPTSGKSQIGVGELFTMNQIATT
jgi:chromosome segregation ATPase